MPYVRVRTRIRKPSRHRVVRSLRIFLAFACLSVVAGFAAVLIAGRASATGPLSIESVIAQQKQKIIDGYKEKYGASWKEKALADYQKYTQTPR